MTSQLHYYDVTNPATMTSQLHYYDSIIMTSQLHYYDSIIMTSLVLVYGINYFYDNIIYHDFIALL